MIYMISHANPLQRMMNKTYHNSQISKLFIFLSGFDLEFISHKSIKVQVIAYQLVEAPLSNNSTIDINLLDKYIFKVHKEGEFVFFMP